MAAGLTEAGRACWKTSRRQQLPISALSQCSAWCPFLFCLKCKMKKILICCKSLHNTLIAEGCGAICTLNLLCSLAIHWNHFLYIFFFSFLRIISFGYHFKQDFQENWLPDQGYSLLLQIRHQHVCLNLPAFMFFNRYRQSCGMCKQLLSMCLLLLSCAKFSSQHHEWNSANAACGFL